PALLREAVEGQEMATFDRAHFKGYGTSSLEFETVYYVKSGDYGVYMDVQQAINVFLFERFAEQDIPFAYPTQLLKLDQPDEWMTVARPEERRAANG
ncbi:MAG TPA: mechanosensitive ion channel protein MscS, partial [Massilia sp.]|nr:mechanosensitive ion channel protein MscS [Massilia sp.]